MGLTGTKHEEKRCPRCKRAFECRANNPARCGCAAVPLTPELLEEISLSFEDCLCAECLREIAGGQPIRHESVTHGG